MSNWEKWQKVSLWRIYSLMIRIYVSSFALINHYIVLVVIVSLHGLSKRVISEFQFYSYSSYCESVKSVCIIFVLNFASLNDMKNSSIFVFNISVITIINWQLYCLCQIFTFFVMVNCDGMTKDSPADHNNFSLAFSINIKESHNLSEMFIFQLVWELPWVSLAWFQQ